MNLQDEIDKTTYKDIKSFLEDSTSEMSSTERLNNYSKGELVDHIPYSFYALDQAATRIYGYDVIDYSKDIEVRKEVIKLNYKNFGIDSYSVGLSLKMLGVAYGSTLSMPKNGIEDIEEHVLKDWNDFEKIKDLDLTKSEILNGLVNTAVKLKNALPNLTITTSVAGPLSTCIAIRPIEKILRDTRRDPELLHELLDLVVDGSLYWVQLFKDKIGSASVNIPDPVTSTSVISYKQFKEFSLPYIFRLVEGIENIMGIAPSMHVCGYSKDIWGDLSETGISQFSLDDVEDIGELKSAVGDNIIISGNVAPVNTMRLGTIKDVIWECVTCMIEGSESKQGYILNTGCQIPIGTPIENLYAFIYAAKKYGYGARIGELPMGLEKYTRGFDEEC